VLLSACSASLALACVLESCTVTTGWAPERHWHQLPHTIVLPAGTSPSSPLHLRTASTNPAAAIHARHAARPSTVTLRHAVVNAVPASSSITRLSSVSFPLNATAVDSRKLQTCRELAGRATAVASVTTVQLDEDYQLWVKVPNLSKHYRLLIARCVAVMAPTPTAMAPTENKMKEFKEVG
jgi:hypothetical protein